MEKFDRGERRFQTARLKKKRKGFWGAEYSYGQETRHLDEKQLGMVVQYPQHCSCIGCGNQRRYVGRSITELCAMQPELQNE